METQITIKSDYQKGLYMAYAITESRGLKSSKSDVVEFDLGKFFVSLHI